MKSFRIDRSGSIRLPEKLGGERIFSEKKKLFFYLSFLFWFWLLLFIYILPPPLPKKRKRRKTGGGKDSISLTRRGDILYFGSMCRVSLVYIDDSVMVVVASKEKGKKMTNEEEEEGYIHDGFAPFRLPERRAFHFRPATHSTAPTTTTTARSPSSFLPKTSKF